MGSEVTRFNGLGGHWSSGVNGIVESLGSLWLLGFRVNCAMGHWSLGHEVNVSLCQLPQDPSEPKPKRQQHPQTPVTIGANRFYFLGRRVNIEKFLPEKFVFFMSPQTILAL